MPTITWDDFGGGLDVRRHRQTAGANQLRVLTNAYVTPGKGIAKRPGLTFIATLPSGTTGLEGVLNTLNVFGVGTVTISDSRFTYRKLDTGSSSAVVKVWQADAYSNYLYCVVETAVGATEHHYLDGVGTSIISGTGYPSSKNFAKAQERIWAPVSAVVRGSKVADPNTWDTAAGAADMPVGRHQRGTYTATAVGLFQNLLVVFFADGIQVWEVDPDPTKWVLRQIVPNIGTSWPRSLQVIAGDLVFLSPQGFRSVTQSANTENLQDADVGSPIDSLIAGTIGTSTFVQSAYYPRANQLWVLTSSTVAYVYTFSRVAKLAAWSKYTFPFAIDAITTLNGELYVRSGNDVFMAAPYQYTDNGAPIAVEVVLPFLNQKAPLRDKMFIGAEAVLTGSAELSFRWDPSNEGDETSAVPLVEGMTGDAELVPVEIVAKEISPVVRHDANEAFSLDSLVVHYEVL